MSRKEMKSAIDKINRHGALLMFPVNNKKEPKSLWSEFYPRTKMRWEWDETGDNRVGHMWLLMKKLSDCREVVYSKWYQGRATFFSRELFTAMLSLVRYKMAEVQEVDVHSALGLDFTYGLSNASRNLLETLESDSPLSTRELKKLCELQGRDNESTYTRSMKVLFTRLLVVAFGEVDDGAFPSLAVGATQLLFEDLWVRASEVPQKEAQRIVDRDLPLGSNFRKFFDKNLMGEFVTDQMA